MRKFIIEEELLQLIFNTLSTAIATRPVIEVNKILQNMQQLPEYIEKKEITEDKK